MKTIKVKIFSRTLNGPCTTAMYVVDENGENIDFSVSLKNLRKKYPHIPVGNIVIDEKTEKYY